MSKSIWSLDPTHSELGFKVKHMMFTNVSGKFNQYAVTLENENDDFSTSLIGFEADITSIDTGNPDRDNHLRSGDFFDAEKFPSMQFRSKSVKKEGPDQYKVTGELTIRDVTKQVELDVEYSGMMKDPWGNTKIGVSVGTKINRKDFGLAWNAALETGGVLVGEEVKIQSELQFVKQ